VILSLVITERSIHGCVGKIARPDCLGEVGRTSGADSLILKRHLSILQPGAMSDGKNLNVSFFPPRKT
jgi:hypothetical protein